MTLTRVRFRTAARAGAVELLNTYRENVNLRLQVYPGRPRSINPPTAFVDSISETFTAFTKHSYQRAPVVDVVVIHGLLDSKEAVDQGDDFVDGFYEWLADLPHAFGARTLVELVRTEDEPNYIPDWLPPELQRSYYATHLFLEGFAAT